MDNFTFYSHTFFAFGRGTVNGFVTLDEEDCTKIYKMMV